MNGFLLGAGIFILLTVLLALLRVLRGPGDAERIMAAQLLGSGGVAALLLLGSAIDLSAATDLALVLLLLAAFVAVAFVAGLDGGQRAVRARNPAAGSD
jgi:multicomponent Na+:H+ antiporter subunit F